MKLAQTCTLLQKSSLRPIALLVALCQASLILAADYTVSSADEFNDLTLNPCDVVTWTDGTYSDEQIIFEAYGESGSPIVLRSETPGGVIFTGDSKINMFGEYLIVDGFYWNGGEGLNNHIEFRKSGSNNQFANNSIFRNCAFNNLITEGDNKSRWIVLYGLNNTIENCSFLNKDSTGACILAELSYQNGGVTGHTIRNNYFYNITDKDGRENSGDSEAIRLGASQYQATQANILVQGNYFLETDGENEIITNKSAGNIYRNNTFRRSRGSLVLRHGAGATIEGNYFLGENKSRSGGIRISDRDHIIFNNYMQELDNSGTSFNNGITLMGGNATSGGTSNGYQDVDNILVAFNTIYNADDPIYFNDEKGSSVPTGVVANNLIYSTNGTLVSGDIAGLGGQIEYEGNVFGGSTVGITDPGITVANADFSASGELYKPNPSGPAANMASGDYDEIFIDIEARIRPTSAKDVGAHEVSGATGAITNTPITDSDVGNTVGACYLDASGNTSTTDCEIIAYGDNCAPIPVTNVAVAPSNASLLIGDVITLAATVIPDNATNQSVTWSSSDNTIATVTASGLVDVLAEGDATITVTTVDGNFTDTALITVTAPPTPPACVENTNLSLNGTIDNYSGQQAANPATNIIDGNISSSNRWSVEGYPNDVTIDLGEAYYVNGINLFPYQDRSYQYIIEGSASSPTDGFITLVDRLDNTTQGDFISDTFNTETVRYIKLTVVDLVNASSDFVSITELEVICAGETLSVNQPNLLQPDIEVYPNPFKDRITISSLPETASSLRLIDISGKVVSMTQIENNPDNITITPNIQVVNGLYFLQILGANGNVLKTEKIIKH